MQKKTLHYLKYPFNMLFKLFFHLSVYGIGIRALLLLGKKSQGLDPHLDHIRGQGEDPGPDQGQEVVEGLLEL